MSDIDELPKVDENVQDIVDAMNDVSLDAPPLPEKTINAFKDDSSNLDESAITEGSQMDKFKRKLSDVKKQLLDTAKKGLDVGREFTGKKYTEVKDKVREGISISKDKLREGLTVGREFTEKKYEDAKQFTGKKYEVAKKGITKAVAKAKTQLQPLTDKMSKAKTWSKDKVAEMRQLAKKKFPKYFDGALDSDLQLFQDRLIEGAEPIELSAGQIWQLPYRVVLGDTIRWDFSCLKFDIYFKVAIRTMAKGGSVEEEVRPLVKCKCGSRHRGSYTAYKGGQVMLIWDNSHSWIRSKHLVYEVEKIGATKSMTETIETENEQSISGNENEIKESSSIKEEVPSKSEDVTMPDAQEVQEPIDSVMINEHKDAIKNGHFQVVAMADESKVEEPTENDDANNEDNENDEAVNKNEESTNITETDNQ